MVDMRKAMEYFKDQLEDVILPAAESGSNTYKQTGEAIIQAAKDARTRMRNEGGPR